MKHLNKEMIPLGIILLLALGIRYWGAGAALPYIYNPDEPTYIGIIQRIFQTGDLNPHFFNYPSLFFYLNALAYGPFYVVEKMAGVLTTRADILPPTSLVMGVSLTHMPATVLLSRLVSILFGLGTVGLVYLAGKQVTGKSLVGLLAAFMTAIAPANVLNSRLIAPDTFVTFFATATFLASVSIYRQGRTWQYILAGACAGLTISSKYNGGIILVPLLLAHFLRHGIGGWKQPQMYLALLFCGIGFAATTPYALLDPATFLVGVTFEARHYASGHWGFEGNTLGWYVLYMGRTAAILYILASCEIVRGIFSRSRELILLASFPVAYFIFINLYVVRNDRTFLPLTPFLFMLAASFLVYCYEKARTMRIGLAGAVIMPALACLALAGMVMPLVKTVQNTLQITRVDSRETARQWIDEHLPAGSKIAIESYSPYVDPGRFPVSGFQRLIDHPADWYLQQRFDYLVFSQGMYARFFQDPGRYAVEVSEYNDLFDRFRLVKVFTDGGYEIRLYQAR